MADGFKVDLDVLAEAADGIDDTIQAMGKCEIEDIVGPVEEYGNETLHDAFENFCDEWQEGVELLLEDAEAIRDALRRAVKVYDKVDDAAAESFGGEV